MKTASKNFWTKVLSPFVVTITSSLLLGETPVFFCRQQAPTESPSKTTLEGRKEERLKVNEVYLKNGLKILLKEDHSAPIVSVGCWYRKGLQDTGMRVTGISHLVEHMILKGTIGIVGRDRNRMIEIAGNGWQGYTFLDQTAHFTSVMKGQWESVLKAEVQRMSWCEFDRVEIEKAKAVVVAELQRCDDDPRFAIDQEIVFSALKIHPYRWPTWGWLQDIQRLGASQLWDYYRRTYTPNNAVLVLVGDFQTSRVLDVIRILFGKIERKTIPPRVSVSEPKQEGERRIRLSRPGVVPYLQMTYPAPNIHQNDFYILLVLDALLCGAKGLNIGSANWNKSVSRTSRLYEALIDSQLATQVYSRLYATRYPYLYKLVLTLPNASDFRLNEETVDYELEKLKAGQFSDHDFDRARNQLRTRFLLDRNTFDKLAHQLGYFESIASFRILESFAEKIENVTKLDLQRVARRIFAKQSRTVGWFIPNPHEPNIEVEKLSAGSRQYLDRLWPQIRSPQFELPSRGNPLSHFQLIGSFLPGRIISKDIQTSRRMSIPSTVARSGPLSFHGNSKRQVLHNGIVVWAVSNSSQATFSLRLAVRAGAARDTDEKAGLAYLTGKLLVDGSMNNFDVLSEIEFRGVSLHTSTDYLGTTFHLEGLSQDFPQALAWASQIIRSASFSPEDFSKEQGILLSELGQEQENGVVVAQQALRERIYPQGHPFRRNIRGSIRSVQGLQRTDSIRFHQRFYRPDQLIISVASEHDLKDMMSYVQESFGDWGRQGSREPLVIQSVSPGLGSGQRAIKLEGRSYYDIVWGLPGVSRRHPDYFPFLILSHILGHMGRLGAGVSHGDSPAFYAFSSLDANLAEGPFMIQVGAIPGKMKSVLAFLPEEIAKLKNEGATQQEVASAQNAIINSLYVRLASNSGITQELVGTELLGLGENSLREWIELVKQVTLDQVIDVSRTRLLFDRVAIIVTGP